MGLGATLATERGTNNGAHVEEDGFGSLKVSTSPPRKDSADGGH